MSDVLMAFNAGDAFFDNLTMAHHYLKPSFNPVRNITVAA
jgi:hypothetical protein